MLEALINPLDLDLRRLIARRVEAMQRQMTYLQERQDRRLLQAQRRWSANELHAIFLLNSFYQIVLAPLASPASVHPATGLGRTVPIRLGETLTFDAERAESVSEAREAFLRLAIRLGVSHAALRAAHADDVLFALSGQSPPEVPQSTL